MRLFIWTLAILAISAEKEVIFLYFVTITKSGFFRKIKLMLLSLQLNKIEQNDFLPIGYLVKRKEFVRIMR